MQQIKDLFTLDREALNFIESYIDQVKNLEECVKILTGAFSLKSQDECRTRIRNIDLWIDANKIKYPELLAFRLTVLKKIQECGLTPYPAYIYESSNHYKK